MTKAEEIFKNMKEEMPWSIIGEKQLKPYILEAMQVYGKYCAEQAWAFAGVKTFNEWWSEFQRKEATEMKYNEKFNLQQLLSDCKGLIDELSRKVSVMERIVNESSVTEDECKKGDCENER